MSFDPYYTWLGIPPDEQPPHHYRLLGVSLFEENVEVICHAADRQMAHIRTFQRGKRALESQHLLNEIAAARFCLLDPARRASYNAKLRQQVLPSIEPSDLPPAAGPAVPGPCYASVGYPVTLPTEPPGVATGPAVAWPAPPSVALADAPCKPMTIRTAGRGNHARRRPSVAAGAVKIVAGGIAGCILGLLILWFGFHSDPLGIFTRPADRAVVQSTTPVPNQPVTPPLERPTVSPRPSPVASTALKQKESQRTEPGLADLVPRENSSDSTPPATATSGAGESAASNGGALDAKDAAVTAAEQAFDEFPTSITLNRVPIPSVDQQKTATRTVTAVYRLDEPHTKSEKEELARRMTAAAVADQLDNTERFVLLKHAASLAVEAGQSRLLNDTLSTMNRHFDIDILAIKEKMAPKLLEQIHDEAGLEAFVSVCKAMIEESMRAERFDVALQLAEVAYDGCQRPYGKKYRKYVFDGRNLLKKVCQEWRDYQAAEQLLATDPEQPGAHRTAGRWLCLQTGDWDRGLGHLVRADDEKLAAFARLDLTRPTDPAARLDLADAWYDLSRTSAANAGFAERALHWYLLALDGAKGLSKQKIEMRRDELTQLLDTEDASLPSLRALRRKATASVKK